MPSAVAFAHKTLQNPVFVCIFGKYKPQPEVILVETLNVNLIVIS